jgi:hypothetical protein
VYSLPFPALVSKFTLYIKVFDPLWFDNMYRVKDMAIVSVFYLKISSFPATFIEETLISPLCILSTFVKNHMAVAAWIYV